MSLLASQLETGIRSSKPIYLSCKYSTVHPRVVTYTSRVLKRQGDMIGWQFHVTASTAEGRRQISALNRFGGLATRDPATTRLPFFTLDSSTSSPVSPSPPSLCNFFSSFSAFLYRSCPSLHLSLDLSSCQSSLYTVTMSDEQVC